MPLVVPGLMSSGNDGDKTSQWMNQLMGKKIGDTSDTTTFAKKDLPQEHRVIKEGDFTTADHKPERLNVYTDDQGVVTKVTHG